MFNMKSIIDLVGSNRSFGNSILLVNQLSSDLFEDRRFMFRPYWIYHYTISEPIECCHDFFYKCF